MISELHKSQKPNWNESIQLEMTLADLQIIYDCIGAVPLNYLKSKHKNTSFEISCYTTDMYTELYDELEDVIIRHSGITDENECVNLDIGLTITGE